MKDFELVVSLSKKQYIRATFIMLTKIKIIRIIPLLIMLPVLLKVFSDIKQDKVNILTYFLPLLPIIIILILIYRVAQKSFAQNKDQIDNKKFMFFQNILKIKVGQLSSEFPKSYIQKLTESKDFLFIWTAKNSAQVIPKNQISEMEVQYVRDFCQI